MSREKGADEIFCRSCGEPIKAKAEICPHCGVRNEASTQNRTVEQRQGQQSGGNSKSVNTPQHDPSNYETTVSENWYYGIIGGVALWVVVLFATSSVDSGPLGAFMGFLALLAWFGMPVATYYDMKYVRANSRWNPNTITWIAVMLIWIINIIGGLVYLYRRHESLGIP